MNIFLSIDDTDNLESPGSGQLSEMLAHEMRHRDLASHCSSITRHQLYVHEAIPYTSHNSSMCFSAVIGENDLSNVIQFAQKFLENTSASGSDPGLCVAAHVESLAREALIAFGQKAKRTVLSKQEAYFLAQNTGVHLSEHGGSGAGIIGALAGIGLRMHGNDGRFRGWLNFGDVEPMTSAQQLCSHPLVDDVVDDEGNILPQNTQIVLAENKIKTVFLNHRQVIPVTHTGNSRDSVWTTLTRAEVKRF